uniref:Uncharacterized protein n=1 Tax=Anthurium amnicola TaxID=1678845 RepID=A0A1D1YEC1_9ARAE
MDNPIKLHAELPGPETRLLGAPAAGLDRAIKHLETFFRLLGFYQHPLPRLLFSWALFLLLGVSVPLVNFLLSSCSSGAGAGGWSPIVEFDACVMASQASLAAVSLLCVSHNLRKYGVRKLLFVGKCYEGLDGLHGQYVDRIKVCAAIQVIGIVICLNAATRISHRAQSLASLASRWHVLATCRSSNDSEKIVNVNCKLDISSVNQATTDHPGEGIKSSDIAMQGKEKFLTFASLQYQRQALVMYLQSNNNGITIYGWAVDRGLINTIFAIELSLLLFVFGRTL